MIIRPLIVTPIHSASETAPTALATHGGCRPSSATATRRRSVAVKTSVTASDSRSFSQGIGLSLVLLSYVFLKNKEVAP